MKKLGLVLLLSIVFGFISFSQDSDLPDDMKIGKHSVAEWKYMVDTTWGEGLLTAEKLALFDKTWEAVDKYYPGFVNLDLDWDSIRNHYRPEIEAGVSRGRFAAIMGKMGYLLKEPHTLFMDTLINQTPPAPEVPVMIYRFPEWILTKNHTNDGWFGAVVTPVDEDHLIVLRCVEDHPLGLEPGDQVIGYDGKAWKDIYPLLWKLELPFYTNMIGGSEESDGHKLLSGVGANWHLFDTINIRKYGSDDTLSLPTSTLDTEKQYFFGNEQLPVEGVEFPGEKIYPEFTAPDSPEHIPHTLCGTIKNTSIAYLYLLHETRSAAETAEQIREALDSIINKDTEGLIIDIRWNPGGSMGWAPGFNRIFNRNVDSCGYYVRRIGGEHSDMVYKSTNPFGLVSEEFLNIPVALILGPQTLSNGDYVCYFIHTQPMTRSFGRSSSTGYTIFDGSNTNTPTAFSDLGLRWDMGEPDWNITIAPRNFGRIINGELKYFIHTGFDIDEKLWFTLETAYNQKDNMVKRAMEWIQSAAYADKCRLSDTYLDIDHKSGPFTIQAGVVNPESHSIELRAKIYDESGVYIEDIIMQELTNESIPGLNEGEWFGDYTTDGEGFYYADICTMDLDENSTLTYPGHLKFTTVKRPELFPESFELRKATKQTFYLGLTNTSATNLSNPYILLSSENPCLSFSQDSISFGVRILAGRDREKPVTINVDTSVEINSEIWIQAAIGTEGYIYWKDSIMLTVLTGNESENRDIDSQLSIYPNPMTESCRIHLRDGAILKKLELCDLSGRIVLSHHNIGIRTYKFNRGNLKSGIYIMRIYADRVYTRKIIIS